MSIYDPEFHWSTDITACNYLRVLPDMVQAIYEIHEEHQK